MSGTSPNDSSDVTQLLSAASGGNRAAFDALLPKVYDELRSLAGAKMRYERAGHTLNPTALVHEAWVRLVAQDRVEWKGRAHFFAVASQAMRRILVNYAEARNAQKRGGGAPHVSLSVVGETNQGSGAPPLVLPIEVAEEVLALDAALSELEGFNPRGARIVEYRFFGGLTTDEIGEALGMSEATVRRGWRAARAWLRNRLAPSITLNWAGEE